MPFLVDQFRLNDDSFDQSGQLSSYFDQLSVVIVNDPLQVKWLLAENVIGIVVETICSQQALIGRREIALKWLESLLGDVDGLLANTFISDAISA